MRTNAAGEPEAVRAEGGWRPVTQIRDHWRVDDRWWAPEPVQRHYYELLLDADVLLTVFQDEITGAWYEQRVP